MDSKRSEEWRKIAREVDSLIRNANGRELFRGQTRQAASEYVSVRCECQGREEQRLDLLKKSGVLPGVEDLPDRPVDGNTEWVIWSEIIRGGMKKPIDSDAPIPPKRPDAPDEIRGVPTNELTAKQSKVKAAFKKKLNAWVKADQVYCLANFRFVKKLGFPNDTKCDSKYVFDMQGWIPVELVPEHDPNFNLPLPVPKRKLKLTDKFAGLSALYDAWFSGAEKIAPWGTMMPNQGAY
jgi:hypothetical protein